MNQRTSPKFVKRTGPTAYSITRDIGRTHPVPKWSSENFKTEPQSQSLVDAGLSKLKERPLQLNSSASEFLLSSFPKKKMQRIQVSKKNREFSTSDKEGLREENSKSLDMTSQTQRSIGRLLGFSQNEYFRPGSKNPKKNEASSILGSTSNEKKESLNATKFIMTQSSQKKLFSALGEPLSERRDWVITQKTERNSKKEKTRTSSLMKMRKVEDDVLERSQVIENLLRTHSNKMSSLSLHSQSSSQFFLPVVRTKPARIISEFHQPFKQGIYKALYSPEIETKRKTNEESPSPPSLSNDFKGISVHRAPIDQAIEESGTNFVDFHHKAGGFEPTKKASVDLDKSRAKSKQVESDAAEPIEEFEYRTIEKMAEEVIGVFKNEAFKQIFEETEKRLLQESVDSFRMFNRDLSAMLMNDFTGDSSGRKAYLLAEFKEYLRKLSKLKLSAEEEITKGVFSRAPYEKNNSKKFFEAVKEGSLSSVKELLRENRNLVFDYDYARMTPLHWAAKKNNDPMCELFIKKGADVNSKDCLGRIPLFFALKNRNVDLVKYFLFLKASPWSSPPSISYEEVCGYDSRIKHFIQRARELKIILQLSPFELRKQIWDKEASGYFGDRKRKGSLLV